MNLSKNEFIALHFLLICACVVKSESNSEHRTVETDNGKIRGILQTTLLKNVEYYSFKGIPYVEI